MEMLRRIKEFNNYAISNQGYVKNISTNKNIKSFKTNSGYLQVSLTSGHKKFYIHRLVATYFIENPINYKCVNHKDGNKTNNKIDNLEWCSYSYNRKHSSRVLGNKVWNIKLNTQQAILIRNLFGKISQAKIAKLFNVSPMVISRIKNNIQLEYKIK